MSFTLNNIGSYAPEGATYSFEVTPEPVFLVARTIRWEIIFRGDIPAFSSDFISMSGDLDFVSGATASQTITLSIADDNFYEIDREFVIRVWDTNNTADDISDDTRIGEDAVVILQDDDTNNFTNSVNAFTGLGDNTFTAASSIFLNFVSANGDDSFIITRFQYGDVRINDTAGSSYIKFDRGVTIEAINEEVVSFGGREVTSVDLILSTGSTITIEAPTKPEFQYQLGDSRVLDYGDFISTLGTVSASLPYVVTGSSTVATPDDGFRNEIGLYRTVGDDIMGLGSDFDLNVTGGLGDDSFIITRFQTGDVRIKDVAGSSYIKFDRGMTIVSVYEEVVSFGGREVTSVDLILSTGSTINIDAPTKPEFQYQFGDGDLLNYEDFVSALSSVVVSVAGDVSSDRYVVGGVIFGAGPYHYSVSENLDASGVGNAMVLGSISATVTSGETLNYAFDGGTLTDSLGHFAITSVGEISYIGSGLDRETTSVHYLKVHATSSDGSVDVANISIEVDNVNEIPVLLSMIGRQTVTIGADLDVSSFFEDGDVASSGDELTYTAMRVDSNGVNPTALPSGLSINADTGIFSASTSVVAGVTHQVEVTVTDSGGSSVVSNVFALYVNTAPIVVTGQEIGDRTLDPLVGGSITIADSNDTTRNVFNDADTGDTLTYTLQIEDATGTFVNIDTSPSPLPSGATWDNTMGDEALIFDSSVAVGVYDFIITATDMHNVSVTESFSVTVNTPPRFSSPDAITFTNNDSTVTEDDSTDDRVSGALSFSDVDDTLANLSLHATNDGTAPTASTGLLTFTSDGTDSTASIDGIYGTFTFTRDATTSAVTWTYLLDNTDSDTNALGSGVFVTESIQLLVRDTRGAVSSVETLSVTVEGSNDAPTISFTASTIAIDEGTLTADSDTGYVLSFSDPEGEPYTFTVDDSRFELRVSDNHLIAKDGAVFDYETESRIDVVITVTNTTDASEVYIRSTTVSIANVYEAPVFSTGTSSSATRRYAYNIAPDAVIDTDITEWFKAVGTEAENIANINDGDLTAVKFGAAVYPLHTNGEYIRFDLGGDYVQGSFIYHNRNDGTVREDYVNGSTVDFIKDGVAVYSEVIANAEDNTDDIVTITAPVGTVFDTARITFSGDYQNFREIEVFGHPVGSELFNINENIDITTYVVYAASATVDALATSAVAYTLGGTDATLFNIDTSSGEVTFIASPDYETKDRYSFSVIATTTDSNNTSLSATRRVELFIQNVNEAPAFSSPNAITFTDTDSTVTEDDSTDNRVSGALSFSDIDDTLADISLHATNDGTPPTASIGELTFTSGEASIVGTYGTFTFMHDATTSTITWTYELDDTDSDTNALDVGVAVTDSVQLLVRDDDNAVSSVETLTVNIEGSNDAPDITVSGTAIAIYEGTLTVDSDTGRVVSFSDPEGDTFSFTTNDSRFALDSNNQFVVQSGAVFDYEPLTNGQLSVTITATNTTDASDTYQASTTISITNVYDAPVFSTGTSSSGTIASVTNRALDVTPTTDIASWFTLGDVDTPEEQIANINDGDLIAVQHGSAVHPIYAAGKHISFALGGDYVQGSFIYHNRNDGGYRDRVNGSTVDFIKDGVTVYSEVIANAGVVVTITAPVDTLFDTARIVFFGPDQNFREIEVFGRLEDSFNIDENIDTTDVVYTASATPDALATSAVAYTLDDGTGTDASSFSIDTSSGEVTFIASPDYEAKARYSFSVIATTDQPSTVSATRPVELFIQDVNEAPTISFTDNGTVSIDEGTLSADSDTGRVVSFSDPEGDTFSFTTNDSRFYLDASNQLFARMGAVFDYETLTNGQLSVTITATNTTDASDTYQENTTISITNVYDAPVFSAGTSPAASMTELTNLALNTVTTTTVDTNITQWYPLGDVDTPEEHIANINDGDLTVVQYGSAVHPQAANGKHISFDLGGDYVQGSFIYHNRNDGSAGRDRVNGSTVAFIKDGAIVYSEVIANAGNIVTITAPVGTVFDTARIVFSGSGQNFREIEVFGRLVGFNINENIDTADVVYAASATADALATGAVAYTLGGTDATLLNIVESTGVVTFKVSPDYETQSEYSFDVIATTDQPSTVSATRSVELFIRDVNDAPDITVSGTQNTITEGTLTADSDTGFVVSASDQDGDTYTYTVDDSRFELRVSDNHLIAKDGAVFDYEAGASVNVVITATNTTDSNDSYDTDPITVLSLTNFYDAPVFSTGTSPAGTIASIPNLAPDVTPTTDIASWLMSVGTEAEQIANINDGNTNAVLWGSAVHPTDAAGTYISFDLGGDYVQGSFIYHNRNDTFHRHRVNGSTVDFIKDGVTVYSEVIANAEDNTDNIVMITAPEGIVFDTARITFSGEYYQNFREIEVFGRPVGPSEWFDIDENIDTTVSVYTPSVRVDSSIDLATTGSLVYRLDDGTGADANSFNIIDTSTGEVTFIASPDYESGKTHYVFDVIATTTNSSSVSKSATRRVELFIQDVNDDLVFSVPTISGDSSVTEDDTSDSVSGSLSFSDTDGSDSFDSLVIRTTTDGSSPTTTSTPLVFALDSTNNMVATATMTYGTLTFTRLTDTVTFVYEVNNSLDVTQALGSSETVNDIIQLVVEDTSGTLSSVRSITVSVSGVNDAPVIANLIVDQSLNEGTNLDFTLPSDVFSDVDGDTLTYTATQTDTAGSALPNWISFNDTTGNFSGTAPSVPSNITISIRVIATDTSSASVYDDFDIVILDVV